MVVVLAQFILAFIGLGSMLVLARILVPGDFGVFAMAFPLLTAMIGIQSLGLDYAIIQKEHIDHPLVNAVFWLSLRYNTLVALGLAAVSPLLVFFFDEPRLLAVNLVLAIGFWILSLGAQHEALLKREMRFGVLTFSLLVATLFGVSAAILVAYLGAGYWALVVQMIGTYLFRTVLAWSFCRWRPQRETIEDSTRAAVLRSVRSYARDLTGTRLLTLFTAYLDRVIVGFISGAAILGLYETARKLAFLMLIVVYIPLRDVAVSGLSRVKEDDARFRQQAKLATRTVFTFTLPAIAFLFVEAEALTLLLLGEQWGGAVPFLRILAVGAFGQCFMQTLAWLYLSTGEVERQTRWLGFNAVVFLIGLLLGAYFNDAIGVAVAVSFVICAMAIPSVIYTLKSSVFRPRDFLIAALRPAAMSILAAAILLGAQPLFADSLSLLFQVAVAATVFAVVYAAGWLLVPGGTQDARELVGLVYKR